MKIFFSDEVKKNEYLNKKWFVFCKFQLGLIKNSIVWRLTNVLDVIVVRWAGFTCNLLIYIYIYNIYWIGILNSLQ